MKFLLNFSLEVELKKLAKEEYATWEDKIIRADLADLNEELQLWNMIRTYQIYRHSNTSRKCRNEKCRFCFGR